MDIGKYFAIFRRGWAWLLAAVIVGGVIGVGFTLTQPKIYRAKTTVYLSVSSAKSSGELSQGSNYTREVAQTFAKMAKMHITLDPVVKELNLDMTPKQLSKSVSAVAAKQTQLIDISVDSAEPKQAADIANAIGRQMEKTVRDNSPGNTVTVTVTEPAIVPKFAVSPSTKMNVILSVAGALGLTVLYLVLRELLDTRIRDEERLRSIVDVPILASVPFDNEASSQALVSSQARNARAEAFRQLRTNLQYIDYSGGLRSLVVTSANSAEGKTSTSINLAESTTALGVTVLLIDADLRRPRVHEALGIEGSVGLSTVLAGLADVNDVIQQFGSKGMYVLPAGQIPPNPSELLGSQMMAHLLNEMTEIFDLIILDAAPTLPVTDPTVLSMLADGAVVVVNAKKTTQPQVEQMMSTLMSAGVRVLGTVLNQATAKKSNYYVADADPGADASKRKWNKKGKPTDPATGQNSAALARFGSNKSDQR